MATVGVGEPPQPMLGTRRARDSVALGVDLCDTVLISAAVVGGSIRKCIGVVEKDLRFGSLSAIVRDASHGLNKVWRVRNARGVRA